MKIEFDSECGVMVIDGVQFSFEALKTFTEPRQGWFYQFERRGADVIVHAFHPSIVELKAGVETELATYDEAKR
jgi:hypothetical protein